jgi:hypothetical protein
MLLFQAAFYNTAKHLHEKQKLVRGDRPGHDLCHIAV